MHWRRPDGGMDGAHNCLPSAKKNTKKLYSRPFDLLTPERNLRDELQKSREIQRKEHRGGTHAVKCHGAYVRKGTKVGLSRPIGFHGVAVAVAAPARSAAANPGAPVRRRPGMVTVVPSHQTHTNHASCLPDSSAAGTPELARTAGTYASYTRPVAVPIPIRPRVTCARTGLISTVFVRALHYQNHNPEEIIDLLLWCPWR
jgi:hypothetical protein